MARLGRFLRDQARIASAGPAVCFLTAADWWMLNTGVDPAAPWRERCGDAWAVARIIAAAGGLEPLASLAMAGVGGRVVGEPCRGDVGLVEVRDGVGRAVIAAAICTGGRWAARGRNGVLIGPAPAVRVWRFEEV